MTNLLDLNISSQSTISLHVQLHNQLRQLILSGRWEQGSLLPSENRLQQHLKISRTTIRLALQSAEMEGLIERVPGKGTFVAYFPGKRERPPVIAFVASTFDSNFLHLLLSGAESVIRANAHQIVFCSASNVEEENELLSQLQDDGVSGILLWSTPDFNQSPYQQRNLENPNASPIVMMDRTFANLPYDCVTSANYDGAVAVLNHLLELGHRRIAFVSHQRIDLLPIAERLRAYEETLNRAGLEPLAPWLLNNNDQEITASDALQVWTKTNSPLLSQLIQHFKSNRENPTAIFAVNDYVAILVLKAARLAGISVPDELSVVGYDDTDVAIYLETPLTTVAQNTFMMGKRAAEMLIERIDGYSGAPRLESVPTQLRLRASTMPPELSERLSTDETDSMDAVPTGNSQV